MGRKLLIGALMGMIMISSCSSAQVGENDSSRQEQAEVWFDAPRPRTMLFPPSPCQIIGHGASQSGIAQFELTIDDETRMVEAEGQSLALLTEDCDLSDPGFYRLRLRTQDRAGVWSEYAETSLIIPDESERSPVTQATEVSTTTPAVTEQPACTNQAQFVADLTIPDNTQLSPGAGFLKKWRLRNSGSCTWGEGYRIIFAGGAALGNQAPLQLESLVAQDATLDVAMNLVAPGLEGTFRSEYLLQNPEGEQFGVGGDGETPFYVQIVVAEPTSTPQPNTPAPDTQAPIVSVSHSPAGSSIPTGTQITFNANASDNVGVAKIELWVTAPGQWPTLVKTCDNSSSCSFTGGPYEVIGDLSYFAIAWDAAGNERNSGANVITIYVLVS